METKALIEGRAAAQRLIAGDQTRRRGEAEVIAALCDLAETYRLDEGELLDTLAERRVRVGGEGTPSVSEHLRLEIAGLLGCTPAAATGRLADAINLKHRHPRLYEAVQLLQIDAARALKAASRCADLHPTLADPVTSRWLRRQQGLGWIAAFNLLDKLIIQADAQLAAEKERKARADRGVWVWGLFDGVMNLTGRLDVLDAQLLEARLDQVAALLEDRYPTLTHSQRRAKALTLDPRLVASLLDAAPQPGLPLDTGYGCSHPPTQAVDPIPPPDHAAVPCESKTADAPVPANGASPQTSPLPHPDTAAPPAGGCCSGKSTAQAPPTGTPASRGSAPQTVEPIVSFTSPPKPPGAPGNGTASHNQRPATGLDATTTTRPDRIAASGASHPKPGTAHEGSSVSAPVATLPADSPDTTPTGQAAPVLHLNVHIQANSLGHLDGAARVVRAGHITTTLLAELLGEVTLDIRVQPVIDLPRIAPADRYKPTPRMRRAVQMAFPTEPFPFSNRNTTSADSASLPYSTRRTSGVDLDHTKPYRPGAKGQTRIGNLAPLSRGVHRAKTAGFWVLDQPSPGQLVWTSPLGYRYDVTQLGTRRRHQDPPARSA